MANILIGTDPELFLFDETVGHIISCHDYLPGTKKDPFLVPEGAVQVDGVAAEFNIFPTDDEDEFINRINTVRGFMLDIIRQTAAAKGHPDPSKLSLVAQPTAYFTKEYFDSLPDSVKVLGCEPDYNIYKANWQQPDRSAISDESPFRTGGFHIHIGWTEGQPTFINTPHFSKAVSIVGELDNILFTLSKLWDSDEKRRTLYGARGSMRPKHYGVEYRPLSNAALQDEEILRFCFRVSKYIAEEVVNNGNNYPISFKLSSRSSPKDMEKYLRSIGLGVPESLFEIAKEVA